MITAPDLFADLTQCDREPITRLEQIQSFGFLLAMSSEWKIVRASANLQSFLGIDAGTALKMQLDALIDREALHEIRNRLTGLSATGGTERLYGIALLSGLPLFDVALHYSDDLCVLEGEPAGLDNRVDAASLVRTMVARLNKQATLESIHRDAARQVRAMTGFDRVMIYRFSDSGHGEVIAESVAAGTLSFLGLQYPATDIPVQARALYLRNPFRIIADVNAPTVPLLPATQITEHALDLSLSIIRAVSPVHLEYLRYMDVAASLSISIIVDGALWGLIACHHGKALLPTFVIRTAAELFGQMYSMTLESRLRQTEDDEDRQARQSANDLLAAISTDKDLLTQASSLLDVLRPMIQCDGISLCFKGHLSMIGSTPPIADVEDIAKIVKRWTQGSLVATDHIAELRPESANHASLAAGVLGIPLPAQDYILLFRRERVHEVAWAGEPVKVTSHTAGSVRLSPRKSFAAFVESVRGRSRPFSTLECRVADALRSGFVDLILRGAQNADAERQIAAERQELLIAELNHRVRNVLTLIRGLISQTNGEGGDAASYVKSLSGRVQALARAHDRVTGQNLGPGPLNSIFEDEVAAYVPMHRERFTIKGPHVLLNPRAFSTLALVVHELVTNSAKYGSLSGSGRVEVTLNNVVGRGLVFTWTELDGPAVSVPSRRGFGSVIIERVVPFDLQGTAIVRYLPEGLVAEFLIPECNVASVSASYTSQPVIAKTPIRPLDGLKVLLLEDNLIVALEAEDMLRGLGADVLHTASTIAAAHRILASEGLDFAVLDVRLGSDTSLDFAQRLRQLRIPFIFTSGYSASLLVRDTHESELTVLKPYDRDHLGMAIGKTLNAYT